MNSRGVGVSEDGLTLGKASKNYFVISLHEEFLRHLSQQMVLRELVPVHHLLKWVGPEGGNKGKQNSCPHGIRQPVQPIALPSRTIQKPLHGSGPASIPLWGDGHLIRALRRKDVRMASGWRQDSVRMASGWRQDCVRMRQDGRQDAVRMMGSLGSGWRQVASGCVMMASGKRQNSVRMVSGSVRLVSGWRQGGVMILWWRQDGVRIGPG